MYTNSIFLRLRNTTQTYMIDYSNGFRIHLSGSKQPLVDNLKIEQVIDFLEKNLINKSETSIDQFNSKHKINITYSAENIVPLLFALIISM